MARIAIHSKIAAGLVGFFVHPTVRWLERPMTLAAIGWGLYVGLTLDGEHGFGWVGAVLAYYGARRIAFAVAGRLPARYLDAFDRGDADELAELNRLFRFWHPDPREREAYTRMRRGEERIVRKRWAEARDTLASVDLACFDVAARAVIMNNLAYATARAGKPDEALAILDRAVAEAERAPPEKIAHALPSLRGTRGIALTLLRRYDEALPLLEQGLEQGMQRGRNERHYWAGVAYRALGREDDARAAFARCIALRGPCTDEAKDALSGRTPFRD